MNSRSRRTFLKEFGLGAAALSMAAKPLGATATASPLAVPNPPQTLQPGQKPIGYAVVGVGSIAIDQFMPALVKTKLSRLTGLVSGHRDKARHFAQLYGVPEDNIYSYDDYDRIVSNPQIDAVYIALPNSLHAEYTIRAAKAGKHVLCEKPMCNSVQDAEEMISACREANRRLMVAYRLRYEPYTIRAITLANENHFGPIKMIDAEFAFVIGDPAQWRLKKALAGGGSLMDIGIYCLQAARACAGEEPVSVYAQAWSSDPVKFREVEENIAFTLKFPRGTIANCYSSYGVGGVNRYRACGVDGWVEMDPAFAYVGLVQRTYDGKTGTTTSTPPTDWDQFATEADAFSDAILHNRDVATPGEEGLRDMKVMMAAYQSAETGKPVKLA